MYHTYSIWGISSVGRASPLQGGCQEFESPILHCLFFIFMDTESDKIQQEIELDEETYQIAVSMAQSKGINVEELLVEVLMNACDRILNSDV